MNTTTPIRRFFKTAWFSKAARKAGVDDEALCAAIRQVAIGQADDLGGGVFKKRLKDNQQRSIILAGDGRFWVFVYLFAKKDRGNINDAELAAFRKLASAYRRQNEAALALEIRNGDLQEICHANQSPIQE
ncbi:MAG: type II toxin-antitoxin system RelE/ParE family toxin [Sulfuricella sp.]|nr:type II toxin-antitoxin system RelE/ParE family toxin [Sulfuricella sp.]